MVENQEKRREEMIAAVREAMEEVRDRAKAVNELVVPAVSGRMASMLRELGLSDREIADVLDVPKRQVQALVSQSLFIRMGTLLAETSWPRDWINEIYGKAVAAAPSHWIENKVTHSRQVVEAHAIEPPEGVTDLRMDTFGAQFQNTETGELILVYSFQRWKGQPIPSHLRDAKDVDGWDQKGRYEVEICSPSGNRQPLPLEILGLADSDPYFGKGWTTPERCKSDDKAYELVTGAIRAHYGIWH